jgi:hypothetical protein
MQTLIIESKSAIEPNILKEIVLKGIESEKKKILFALEKTKLVISKYEKNFNMNTSTFIDKFSNQEIEENDDTFSWWAESKLLKEIETKLNTLTEISIC